MSKIEVDAAILKFSSRLPHFERLILEKKLICDDSKDVLKKLITISDKNSNNLHKLLKLINSFLYQECHSVFSKVFKDFSSEQSKEVARNNVRRLATGDNVDEVNKLGSKVYGEIDFFGFGNILERLDVKKGDTFYDLGHGTGKAMVAAALLFGDKIDQVSGVELLTDLYENSVTAITSYNQLINSSELDKLFDSRQGCNLNVYDGDFLLEPFLSQWTNSDIVFANSTCFDHDLMQRIADFAIIMRPGSRLITFTSSLPSSSFTIIEKINLGMSWGTATVYIHVRK